MRSKLVNEWKDKLRPFHLKPRPLESRLSNRNTFAALSACKHKRMNESRTAFRYRELICDGPLPFLCCGHHCLHSRLGSGTWPCRHTVRRKQSNRTHTKMQYIGFIFVIYKTHIFQLEHEFILLGKYEIIFQIYFHTVKLNYK